MRNTTRQTGVEANSPRNRRLSRKSSSSRIDTDDMDISALLREDVSSSREDSNLESIFRRQVTNPFSGPDTMAKISAKNIAEEREMEELSRLDTSRIYTTGYSIHMLTPYLLIVAIICVGFFVIDHYFFNIIEFLSEDIRYKIPAYGVLILVFSILIYFFIKECLEYASFEMIVTKYKIVQGSKRTTVKNELPYYSIQEFINDRGLFGRLLNYGKLSIYLTTRRTIDFEKLHGAQYVYDIIQRLKYGTISEALEKNDEISAMISGAEKIENLNKEQQQQPAPLDMTFDLNDLGFTEDELREMGMSSSSKTSSSGRNRRKSGNSTVEDDDVELDVIELENVVENEKVSRRSSRSGSTYRRRSGR